MRKILVLGIVFLLMGTSTQASLSWEKVKISRVLTNGNLQIGNGQKVRILGIKPLDKFAENKKEKCHYRENFLQWRKLLNSSEFLMTKISENPAKKSILPHHFKQEKTYLAEIILRNGWGKLNEQDELSSYFSAKFKRSQEFAQKNKLGVWAECRQDVNWRKIREKFGERTRKFNQQNNLYLSPVAVGEVQTVLTGNEFKLKNGLVIKLQNVEIPTGDDQASSCFRENSRNFLENLLLGKKVRLEKENNFRENFNYKLVRNVYLISNFTNKKVKRKSVNQMVIENGFGKYLPDNSEVRRLKIEQNLAKIQQTVYQNPRGAWRICAREILNTDFSAKKEDIRVVDETCPIKGNISGTKRNPIKTYHTVASGWYDRLQAEQCFSTEDGAKLAGFVKVK